MGKMKKSLCFLAAAVIVGAGASATALTCAYAQEKSDTIAEGVYIGDINVGGMTEQEAAEAVNAYVESLKTAEFTLEAGNSSVTVSAADMGISFSNTTVIMEAMDVGKTGSLIKRYKDKKDLEHGNKVFDLKLDVDEAAVAALVEEQSAELNQQAVDNGLERKNGTFEFIEGAQGIEVNAADSVNTIVAFVNDGWDGTDASISLAAEVVEPRGTMEELSKIQDLLGSYTTNYSTSSSNRCTNIANAASKIDGTLLYPGEEFSVYETIGPLDAANGYELAGSYENGQTVDSYGGGVCQVSTTLYNAVILAELEITQRSNHSMIVTYVKPSMDAAIAGDYKDLRFVNNLDTPIYIEGYTVGKDLYFNIFGEETRPANRKVTYESEVVSQEDPPTQYVATTDPAGTTKTTQSKHTGYVAQLWKIVTVDGVEQSREVFNKSTYKASPKIVGVGTASDDPNISAILGAAIASGDEAAINEAVANAAAAAAAAAAAQQPVEEVPQQ